MQKDQLILEFRLANLAKGLSPKTIKFYDDNLKIFFSHKTLKAKLPEAITPSDIRKFLASKREKVSPHTLHCYYRTLRRFFNFLREEGYLEDSPLDKVQSPKLPKLQPRFLNRDEIKQFFGVINKKSRNYIFFLFLLDTGVRLSEALNLRIKDLDIKNQRALILGKGNRQRYIFYGLTTARYLLKYLRDRDNGLVFVSSGGKKLDPSNVNHICKRISKKVGLTKISPHTFRHTMATQFLENNGNLIVLQRLLGHASIEMTSRYTHFTIDSLFRHYVSAGDNF